jgi:Protein of unknown function (DUF3102)
MTLPNRTIAIITSELHVALRRKTADILIVGCLLAEAKEKIPHCEWLPWLKAEFSMSERRAQKYVKAVDYEVKNELGADLNLSPSALFLLSRYDRREFTGAVIKAAKEKRLGCDQVREIVQDISDRAKPEGGATNDAPQDGRSQGRVSSRDKLVFNFTSAFLELHRQTKSREAARFTKSRVKADDLARLGQLLTDLASLKAEQAALEVSIDLVARHGHV